MLLLADRNFYSYALWRAAAGTGADLLWRVKASLHLPVAGRAARRVLPGARQRPRGGARPGPPQRPAPPPRQQAAARDRAAARHHRPGHRVLRHRHRRRRPHPHRTVPADHHAGRLARLPRRGAGRLLRPPVGDRDRVRRIKTCLRGPGRVLRGRTPDLARQELWAYLAIYQAIRALIARAAAGAGLDPARISFTAALNAAQRTLGTSPAALPTPWPPPRPRCCPAWSPSARAASAPAPSTRPALPTRPGAASPAPYHNTPATPSPSPHPARPHKPPLTRQNNPHSTRQPPLNSWHCAPTTWLGHPRRIVWGREPSAPGQAVHCWPNGSQLATRTSGFTPVPPA